MACPAPDGSLGTALRVSSYLDCNAELIGREGFLALASSSTSSGLLLAIVTIFVALIGYRLLLGDSPGLSDGIGWALRLGAVLALLGGWSAFQTLFYDVAIGGPSEISQHLLGSVGLPAEDFGGRIQRVYDTLRLGIGVPEGGFRSDSDAALASASAYPFQLPMPKTAIAFLLGTTGLAGATRLAAAFLLAIAPFPIMALLFASSFGLFIGWLRALITTVFAGVAVSVATGLELVAVEAELARLQGSVGIANAQTADSQAVVAIILIFGLVALGMVLASSRLAGAVAEAVVPLARRERLSIVAESRVQSTPRERAQSPGVVSLTNSLSGADDRVVSIAEALGSSVAREQKRFGGSVLAPVGQTLTSDTAAVGVATGPSGRFAARRSLGRRHRSAMRRDRLR